MLKVGSEAKRFLIHKDVLFKQSPYFRAALAEGRWKESQDNTVELDETDPNIFKDFLVEWLYTGKLDENLADTTCIKGYIFADRYDFPKLRFDVIANLHKIYTKKHPEIMPAYKAIILAFDNLPPTCKLCEFLMDLYGARWDPHCDDDKEEALREQLPISFLVGFMVRLGNRKKVGGGGYEHNLGHYIERTEETQTEAPE